MADNPIPQRLRTTQGTEKTVQRFGHPTVPGSFEHRTIEQGKAEYQDAGRLRMSSTSSNPGQRGAVRNPQMDGRLKHNRQNGTVKMTANRMNAERGGQGRVKNPTTDRRLKINR